MWNYVVTAHKPSNVNLCVTGNFTSPNEQNLIVAKCNRLVIYKLTADGLQPVMDTPIYGRIANLELYRINGAEKDLLFLTSERWKFCVLEYDSSSGELLTRAMGDVSDRIGKAVDSGQIAHIDPERRLIGLHIYDGFFKVIPIDPKGSLKEAFNIRLEELQVIDLQFLYGCAVPTILLLYQDPKEMRHLKTYEVSIKDKDFQPGPWQQTGVEMGATLIIPVPMPLGGAVLVGEQTLTYLNGDKGETKTIPMSPTVIRAWGKIDDNGSRYLLGDHFGRLYVLVLEHDGSKVLGLKLDLLGETSCAQCISYLDSCVIFVGSPPWGTRSSSACTPTRTRAAATSRSSRPSPTSAPSRTSASSTSSGRGRARSSRAAGRSRTGRCAWCATASASTSRPVVMLISYI